MKKEKLTLDQLKVSSFKTTKEKKYIVGGSLGLCDSVSPCVTLDVSACYGNNNCQAYETEADCTNG